ncbi:MAG: glycoside hydrolase family 9 protein [Proteobacteria bacterium]|nr:glycoside hydrolase family 9 protein [Pseudomonadota bacterium]MBU1648121.1 glycoside hydrolase family 9 protein [Pseudomonadota bacterium]MBU1986117.1 glycoside hydrolase family 9 protein [Pseudomonadota bacterium]
MSTFSNTVVFSSSLRIFFCILLLVAIIPQAAWSAVTTLTPSGIFPVTSSLISISFTSPPLPYGTLTSYTKQATDHINTDKNGNSWLSRNGRRTGAIVGPRQENLFRFSGTSFTLPKPTIFDKAGSYTISSEEDQTYRQPVPVKDIGRKSLPTDSVWDSTGLQVQVEHTIYLKLTAPLQAGATYHLTLPPALDHAPITFTYDPELQISKAIHVNQIGFRSDSPAKHAFLSLWAGSLGPIDFAPESSFSLIEETSGEKVYSATIVQKKSLSDQHEDAYGKNYNGTDIYLLNFNSFTTPGTYHIFVDGVGRSPSFKINSRIWRNPLYLALRAFYHQRSGIALTPPYATLQRPRSLHPDDGQEIMTSDARLMDTGNGFIEGLDNFSELKRQATSTPLKNGWGGYHDAGDWDRRIQHLLVTRNLLDLYTLFPEFFSTMSLNIPESTNTLPDTLDEALWPLDFFCRLQEADGSVRGGIEATGHPYFGEPSWLERHQLLAYRPGIWSTYLFAATAAQAARTLSQSTPERAEDYRRRAILAMQKAEELLAQDSHQPFQINDARNLAAIELFKLTNDPVWHQIFLKTTVLTQPGVPLFRDEQHDQAEAAWSYLLAANEHTNPEIRANCRSAVLSSADSLLAAQEKAGFSWLKDPSRPPFAGAFTIPFTRDVIRAWILTGNPRYSAAVELSMQSVLGANALNLSYTTGLGSTPVHHPCYPDARISGQEAPAGITVLGPLDLSFIRDNKDNLLHSYGSFCYPDIRQWPVMETFLDLFWFPLMTEFSIETMAKQVYTWGFLAAYPTRKISHAANTTP